MKRVLLIVLALVLIGSVLPAQISYTLNDYGRIRLSNPAGVRQIDRVSINVGVSQDVVYHYKDIGGITPVVPAGALTATIADAESYCLFTYNTGDAAIDVTVSHHIYFWNTKNWMIIRNCITNNTASAVSGKVAFELIPQVSGAYGDETVDILSAANTIYAYKASDFTGMTYLNLAPVSFRSMAYSAYAPGGAFPDSLQWAEMCATENSTYPLNTGSDGTASFMNAGDFAIPAGDSAIYFIAVGYGSTVELLALALAEAAYTYATTFYTANQPDISSLPSNFELRQNYPNPFNPTTRITFVLAESRPVELTVYDLNGHLINTLYAGAIAAGQHTIEWNACDQSGQPVAAGVYLYRLTQGAQTLAKKMILMR